MDQVRIRLFAALFLGCGLLLAITGCGQNNPNAAKDAGPADKGKDLDDAVKLEPVVTPPEFAGARTIFDTNCAKCHPLGGSGGGKGKMKGPDLAKVGADPIHTRDWIVAYVLNPKAQNPKSRMPKFEGKLAENEILEVAEYLTTLK